jgi:hypothetical protein
MVDSYQEKLADCRSEDNLDFELRGTFTTGSHHQRDGEDINRMRRLCACHSRLQTVQICEMLL